MKEESSAPIEDRRRRHHVAEVITAVDSSPPRKRRSTEDVEEKEDEYIEGREVVPPPDEEEEEDQPSSLFKKKFVIKTEDSHHSHQEKPINEEGPRVRRPIVQEEIEDEGEDEGDEGDSEDSEDSDEEEDRPIMLAPVFKRKSDRSTMTNEQHLEAQRLAAEEEKLKRLEERKVETMRILELEKEKNAKGDLHDELPDELSDGDGDPTEEFESWKLRELVRIKAEKEEKNKIEREKAELERRKKLTDAEIMEEDKELLAPKEKSKLNFMQKYYHKGAFFRTYDEEDQIENKWDFNQPTLEDKHDKSILPQVMQVKNFGKRGRTKYTHLVDQDTSKKDAGWSTKETADLQQKLQQRAGGMGSVERNSSRK
eukprot:TRINITY_DN8379_c0_g1_i2.p1 TRINITY_DN8379_c0_g1~~TRINITY_DN8379_c0_g1_i2.p1  ORF type:complete len:369 (-),score=185.29 TRINITY_DN8379_c0_g1_i2:57-1163(-)